MKWVLVWGVCCHLGRNGSVTQPSAANAGRRQLPQVQQTPKTGTHFVDASATPYDHGMTRIVVATGEKTQETS